MQFGPVVRQFFGEVDEVVIDGGLVYLLLLEFLVQRREFTEHLLL